MRSQKRTRGRWCVYEPPHVCGGGKNAALDDFWVDERIPSNNERVLKLFASCFLAAGRYCLLWLKQTMALHRVEGGSWRPSACQDLLAPPEAEPAAPVHVHYWGAPLF